MRLTPEEKTKRLQKRRENANSPAHFHLSPAPTAKALVAVIKKTFGRSFVTSVFEKDGKVVIQSTQRDTGQDIMTLNDLEAMLQSILEVLLKQTQDADPLPHF